MATAYDEIAVGTTSEERALEDHSFTRTYEITDLGTIKQAEVTVSWSYKGQTQEVSLTTLIAPPVKGCPCLIHVENARHLPLLS